MKYNKLPRNEQNLQYIKEGNIEKLITSNTLYIHKLVSRLPIDDTSVIQDLIQEGRIGIYTAYQSFDPEQGIPFIGYAKYYIKKAIFAYLEKYQNTIKTPKNKFWDANNHIKTISTAIKLNDDSNSTVEDLLEDKVEDNDIDDQQYIQNKAILKRFSELSERHQYIVSSYLGLDPNKDTMTFQEIAEEIGTSRQNVEEIYKRILLSMQSPKKEPKRKKKT